MKNKFKLVTVTILFLSTSLFGQEYNMYSAHKFHKEYFDSLAINFPNEFKDFSTAENIPSKIKSKDCNLESIVFGWHPYWSNGLEDNYQWHLLSDLSYFSYDVDPVTGDPTNTHEWETVSVIDSAQANGVRVNLCITLFSGHASFFASSGAQQNLIDNLLTLVQNRNADGVNIDFESVPGSEAIQFNNFLVNLATQFHTEIPGSQVSIELYAVDWSDVFDIQILKDYIDLFIIMGYDYYYSGSSIAGPTGQLYRMNNFNYTIARSIAYYLHEGVPREKLVCGLPYYGWEWETESDNVPANTIIGTGASKTIKTIKNNSNGYYSNRQIDANSMSAYYNYNNGQYHQAWVDDELTMKYKYDVVQQQGIVGIGIWALGYDDGYTEMWDLIESTFTDCAETPCYYEFYDMGGPHRKHFDFEDYTFTIAPINYTDYLALNFTSFELEPGYDTLWIYDGADTNALLIGGYSGTTSPGIVEASGNALTLKFYSDTLTVKHGWTAEWRCTPVSVDVINETDINVYPNPASDIIYINSTGLPEVQIISINGKLINTFNASEINISGLKNGIYFLKIITDDKIFVKKIIINR